jgi:pimeloyl-ACP methyl ester carboxylesterase
MGPLFEHRLELAGLGTRALELAGDGPGLVLLHGWGDSADTWRPILAELGRRGRRAIAVDLPGFGDADRLAPGPILPQLDAFAAALVTAWASAGPVVVAGASLGGCIALRLAEHPDGLPVAGVVPVSPAGIERPGWFDAIEHDPIVRRLLALPIPVPTALVRRAGSTRDGQVAFPFGDPRATQRAAAEAYSGRGLLPELSAAPFDLAAIECPVLLVWGARDRALPHTGARLALDALPRTQVELIEDCGRRPQLEAAARLAELLLGFQGA